MRNPIQAITDGFSVLFDGDAKEGTVALAVVIVITLILAFIFMGYSFLWWEYSPLAFRGFGLSLGLVTIIAYFAGLGER